MPWIDEKMLTVQAKKVSRICWTEYQTGEVCRENDSEELQKVSTEYSEESWSVDSSEQTTWGPEKKFLEEFEETVPGTHIRPEKVPVSTCQTG